VVPLGAGAEALWLGHDSKVRRWVRRAERNGVEIEVDRQGDRLCDFVAVYDHTMRRTGADAWYRFPLQFFEAILARLEGHFVFLHALAGGRVVSSDLVLHAGGHAYYFLGGTLQESFPLGPNYLLKHKMASWAESEGMEALVLGGGHLPNDGLFHYKRSFARHGEVPFRVATLVNDETACAALVQDRARHAERRGEPWAPRPGFFPSYRA
jgi:lipid II:glycine glycyltransferase (peptidoglycan interpeptide bridge formation enzyme)